MTDRLLGADKHRVRFLAVSSGPPGHTLLASHAADKGDYATVLSQIFASPGWAAVLEDEKSRLELKSGEDVYCVRVAPRGLCAAGARARLPG